MSSPVSLTPEEKSFFSALASVSEPVLGTKVDCLVRLHDGCLSVESNNFLRRFWIWLCGTKEEYNLQKNVKVLSEAIHRGLVMNVRGNSNGELQKKVEDCYSRYKKLISYYADRHKDEGFNQEAFRLENLFRPQENLWREKLPADIKELLKTDDGRLSPMERAVKDEFNRRAAVELDAGPWAQNLDGHWLEERVDKVLDLVFMAAGNKLFGQWEKENRSEGKDVFVAHVKKCIKGQLSRGVGEFLLDATMSNNFKNYNFDDRFSKLEERFPLPEDQSSQITDVQRKYRGLKDRWRSLSRPFESIPTYVHPSNSTVLKRELDYIAEELDKDLQAFETKVLSGGDASSGSSAGPAERVKL